MLVAEPGAGKSAFALYGLVKSIVTGCDWFNGMQGPEKPGCVLWCDTEGCAAITVQRIKDWDLPPERIKVPFEDDPLMPINLGCCEHLERIEAVINRYRTKLVVIDSLRGAHDGEENNSRVAQVLQKLAAIAEGTREAVHADSTWYFSRLDAPCATWITPDRLAEQERLLPGVAFRRSGPTDRSAQGVPRREAAAA